MAKPLPPDAGSPDRKLLRRLDLVLASLRDYAIVLLDLERRVIGWNTGARNILQYDPDEILGRSADILFTPEDRDAGEPDREQIVALRTGRAEDERWHLRKDGSRFYGSGVLSAIRDEDEALLGFVKIMRDHTERRQAAAALQESEERYRRLVEGIRDYAIFMLDRTGRVTSWTDAAQRITGYTAQEIVGQHFEIFFTPEDRERRIPALELLEASNLGRYETVGWRVRRDGTRFWADEIATAVRNQDGSLLGISKIMRDITDRMLAEVERERLFHQATEANRIKDEFLGTMSHELRTPLNAILGWTHMLSSRSMDDASRERALEIIERNARSQAAMIDDLLDVSRIAAGKLHLHLVTVNVREVIASAVETVQETATSKHLQLDTSVDSEATIISADAGRLRQAILNLLTNAIKFTPSGGTVRIAARNVDNEIEISVQDTGVGISADFLPFVFDRFRQADSSLTRAQSGLGLGLAIVKEVIELHGGSVSAESEGPERGSTFRIRLPRVT